MKIRNSINNVNQNNNTNGKIGVSTLYNEIKMLEPLFEHVILVNSLEKREILVHEYKLEDSHAECYRKCPLINDTCGCICKDTVSTGENRVRFIYNKTAAYMVISKLIKMQYRDYTLVIIMKLNPSFSFGAFSETDAIDNITKLSSNLVIDPLTNIFNRKYYMDNIDFMMQSAMKQRKPLCLACIDIDNFKRFNDTYGHEFGDLVLKQVAKLMTEATNVMEEVYNVRIGGDEFLIIGVNIDKKRFKAIMNKLCLMVDDCKLPYGREKVGIRISIGVSEMLSDGINNYKALYDKADTQLYAAKEAGKGCVR